MDSRDGSDLHPSVTIWIDGLKLGRSDAPQQIWERYFTRLCHLAKRHLHDSPCRAADQEDVALSAMDSFFRGTAEGRFPKLDDRDDLWKLLVVITARKACDQRTLERRKKRGGGAVRGESVVMTRDDADLPNGFERFASEEPTPELAVELAEQSRRLFAALGDDDLRQVALLKMESRTDDEIAGQLGCARRTVQRKLRLIQEIWTGELARSESHE
jgi:RNA polymerase sigma factor (sigma-70 family)